MTTGVMLEVAKESTRCESYEEAQQILMERNININDDTLRQAKNTVGGIVFNNDVVAVMKHGTSSTVENLDSLALGWLR
jgi:hypothetical protein